MITEIENCGTNVYSPIMQLVIIKADSLDEVKKSDTYFLNPSAPMENLNYIYAFKGTAEQYKKEFAQQCMAQIQKRVIKRIEGDLYSISKDEFDKMYKEEEKKFVPWWEELQNQQNTNQ